MVFYLYTLLYVCVIVLCPKLLCCKSHENSFNANLVKKTCITHLNNQTNSQNNLCSLAKSAWEHYNGIRALNPPNLWGLAHAEV
jgi:hypothetical protein